MSHRIINDLRQHRSARTPRRRRVRSWIAWFALGALAFASLGLLPSIGFEFATQHRAATHPAHHDGTGEAAAAHQHPADHRATGAAHNAHGDFSDIPGSPTHPIDHDCDQCQVLTHLSRCIVVAQPAPNLDPAPGCPVRPGVAVVTRAAHDVAVLPPARGPPRHSA